MFLSVVRHGGLLLLCWMVWVQAVWAQPRLPEPPEVAVRSFLVLDVTTNQILASRQPDMEVEPASLTKLMTAYIVFDALRAGRIRMDQTFSVSERAWRMPGSRMFIEPRMQVPVEDLLKGMIVQSGNDATIALAEGLAGSVERFVELMNQQALALGMTRTRYMNPEGLTAPGHMTTARDLSILASRLIKDFPEYVGLYAIQRYRFPGTPAANDTNRNLLLFRDPTVDGLKTGFTAAAGYCLVATARRQFPALGEGAAGERRLISIVLGASSANARAAESQRLLNWGFSAFEAVRLFEPGQAVIEPDVWKGRSRTVRLGREDGVMVSIPAGQASALRTEVLRTEPLVAPLLQGQPLGTLRITTTDGDVVAEVPLFVLETVREAGFWGRLWGAIRLWLR
jgi:D-alanyl-D-alanine carboxypeptidase (penicillin-binding protein 5/6)